MHRKAKWVEIAVVLVVLAVGTSVALAAKPGNSQNAKQCQKGGYIDWVRADGTSFASEDECVSYAAEGGTLTEPGDGFAAAQALCEQNLGQFFPGTDDGGYTLWTCFIYNSGAQAEVEQQCRNDSGIPVSDSDPTLATTCILQPR